MTTLYIQTKSIEKIAVVTERDKITEITIDRPGFSTQVGNIYVGKVAAIEGGMQAAFIDIGADKVAFLKRNELPEAKKNPNVSIESIITEGQTIVVQVIKDAYGSKGATLTANITIPGATLVYLPYGDYVAVSRRIEEPYRQQLKILLDQIRTGEEGAILRTSAQTASAEVIQGEYEQLREKWSVLVTQQNKQKVPSCLFQENIVPDRFLRDYAARAVSAIYFDSVSEANRIKALFPALRDRIHWKEKLEASLPKTINQMLEEITDPSVKLSGGIELVIEHTEALTVIDINSGGYTGKLNKEDTVTKVNVQAANAVAEQLRLRNVSGLIVIDFIGMKSRSNQEKVLHVLNKALANDPIRTEVYGFTKLGLVEMTRKRESYALSHLLETEHHRKPVFSPDTKAYMLERELLSYRSHQAEAILIDMHPNVYKAWTENQLSESLIDVVRQDVYVRRTKSTLDYQIKLAGSGQLIADFIIEKKADSIDKLF
ncbi:Rne/Rng family ribonuclease [Radiobacillus sp. PE A8.2]|uniref:Rne/Rng family ribonuclease n=1 Tax=Radiobacillus sp. PE A8.2 TaxID=3380349 RepID=UPI00388FCE14